MPATVADIAPAIGAFVNSGDCNLIVGLGFRIVVPMEQFVAAHPDQRFVAIDNRYEATYPNLSVIEFQVDEAAFLAGYVAAGTSATGKVGVYGGAPIWPVTIFMDGYALRVEHYNAVHGTDIEVLGWDPTTSEGLLLDWEFQNPALGELVTRDLFDQGADTVFAVAGVTGLGSLDAATARKEAGEAVRVIEPDVDLVRRVRRSSPGATHQRDEECRRHHVPHHQGHRQGNLGTG